MDGIQAHECKALRNLRLQVMIYASRITRLKHIPVALAVATLPRMASAEIMTFDFDVCGAPTERVTSWMPNGDPHVNGKVTLTIDTKRKLMSLMPSVALMDSLHEQHPPLL